MRKVRTLLVLVTAVVLAPTSFADNSPTQPAGVSSSPACLAGQRPGIDCPAAPTSTPNADSKSQAANGISDSIAPTTKITNFVSQYPADRSLTFFNELKPPDGAIKDFGVAWDSSSRIQDLPYISVEKNVPGLTIRSQHICETLTDSTCSASDWQSAFINSTIGVCEANSNAACVANFSVTMSDGKKLEALPENKFPNNSKEFSGYQDSNTFIPGGITPWIWRAGTEEYLLTGSIMSAGQSDGKSWGANPRSFYFEIIPVQRELSNLIKTPVRVETKARTNGIDYSTIAFDYAEKDCIANDEGVCLHRKNFNQGARFKVALKIPHNLSGWLDGRLNKPQVSIIKGSGIMDQLTIDAGPSENIMGGGYVAKADVSQADWNWMNAISGNASTSVFNAQQLKNQESNFYVGNSGEYGALEWFRAWNKFFGRSPLRTISTWTVQSTMEESTGNCVKKGDGIQGIVSTNAAVYSAGAPQFDATTRALTFQVAGPAESQGNYALSMSDSLLKCLYAIQSIPSQAKITLTQISGSTMIQTTSLTNLNNWVNFSAGGFTFENLDALSVNVGQIASNKITIKCSKGKLTKSITDIKPTCPSGFKKAN